MKIRTDIPIIPNPEIFIKKITKFWNKTTPAWRDIWGTHFHHGYFEGNETKTEAQEKLLQKLIEIFPINPNSKILDVGCGVGGSSLFFAKQFQMEVTGISLSNTQIAKAREEASKQSLSNICFLLEDAHKLTSFANESFDFVWSLESCEQFYNKALFIKQANRVLKKNGKLLIATWCSNSEEFSGKLAKDYLKICRGFDTPYMPTIASYQRLLSQENFIIENTLDWSGFVKKSWQIGTKDIYQYPLLKLIRFVSFKQLYFLYTLRLMQYFFEQGHLRYGVFVLKKS